MKPDNSTLKIVALLFRRVGDSLLATPALRAIKKHSPDATLRVIVEPQVVRVFERNPMVDDIVVTEKSPSPFELARLMRGQGRPDIVLDFLSDPRTAIACFLSGAAKRVGFKTSIRSLLYTHRVPLQDEQKPIYSALHKLGLAKAVGAEDDSLKTDFFLTDEDIEFEKELSSRLRIREATKLISIFPYSRRDYKRWQPDRYISLCRKLQAVPDFLPILISGPGEAAYCSSIATAAGFDEKHVVVFDDLGRMAAFLQASSLYVGNDGGPKHLAVAMNTPTVTIFLNDPPEYWTPPDTSSHAVLSSSGESGITIDAVLDEIHRVLNNANR